MDGLEATRLFRAKRSQGPVIVAMTAYTHASQATQCIEAGMDGCITKPVSLTDLRRVIEDVAMHRPVGTGAAAAAASGAAAAAGGATPVTNPSSASMPELASVRRADSDSAVSVAGLSTPSSGGRVGSTPLAMSTPPPPPQSTPPHIAPALSVPSDIAAAAAAVATASEPPVSLPGDEAALVALAEAAAAGQPAISDTQNLELSREAGFLSNVVDSFLSASPATIQEARELWAAGDWVEARKAVHKLKGSSGNLGAMRLVRLLLCVLPCAWFC
jgi:CheY-like chemotaxis protein